MPSPFATYTLDQILQALNTLEDEAAAVARKYVEGDHWQDGDGWKGPQFEGTDAASQIIKRGIERDFTSKNTSGTVVRRRKRGVLGREPVWTITLRRPLADDEEPDERERKLLARAETLALLWWNQHRVLLTLREIFQHRLTSRRGVGRFYVPPAELRDGRVPRGSLEDSIKRIHLLAPDPSHAAVITDTRSMRRAGIYSYTRDGRAFIELSYLDDDGRTVVRTLSNTQTGFAGVQGMFTRAVDRLLGKNAGEEFRFRLAGKLMILEMTGEPVLTEQTNQNQALLAKALTMLSHNLDESGFRNRVFFNAQPPGEYVTIPDPKNAEKTIEVFMPGVLPKGASADAFVRGVTYEVEEDTAHGKRKQTHLSTPSLDKSDPIPVTTYEDSARIAHHNILEDCDQLHMAIAGDADISGESRKQSRDDHVQAVDEDAAEVDYFIAECIEGALALAANFAGEPGVFDEIRVAAKCNVHYGPVSADDRRLNIEERDAGIRTTEDAIQQTGQSDPVAVKQKIDEERKTNPLPKDKVKEL